MVKAWIADVSSLYDRQCYEKYYALLPDFRKHKADKLKQDTMKAQSVGVWILWQKIRKKYGLAEEIPFNFSHSGTLVMCAACVDGHSVQVGCDVEKTGELRLKVAERYFCPEEYETIIREKSEEKRRELFFRYWVLKESFLKATRKGMALPLNQFCIRIGDPSVLICQPEAFPGEYHYCEYSLTGQPYRMAVCSTDAVIDAELQTEFML